MQTPQTTNTSSCTRAADLVGLLKQHFGFDEFRPGQQQTIDALLQHKGALAVFPTGGGKSLCYQLPALTLNGLTLNNRA